MNKIFIVPGFNTDPNGDCLGMRPFAESLAPHINVSPQNIFCVSWDKCTPDFFQASPGEINIGLFHSYGCAAAKRCLDKNAAPMSVCAWFDPVPRFWWKQFRFGPRWKFPIAADHNLQFTQSNDPLLSGYPFQQLSANDKTYDVSRLGVHHSDIPGNSIVLQTVTRKILSYYDLQMPGELVESLNDVDGNN